MARNGAKRLNWTERASQQLFEAWLYIAPDDPSAADQMAGRILSAAHRLATHPLTGRPGRRKGTRELPVPRTPYLLISEPGPTQFRYFGFCTTPGNTHRKTELLTTKPQRKLLVPRSSCLPWCLGTLVVAMDFFAFLRVLRGFVVRSSAHWLRKFQHSKRSPENRLAVRNNPLFCL